MDFPQRKISQRKMADRAAGKIAAGKKYYDDRNCFIGVADFDAGGCVADVAAQQGLGLLSQRRGGFGAGGTGGAAFDGSDLGLQEARMG
jgi:hypothetical protein